MFSASVDLPLAVGPAISTGRSAGMSDGDTSFPKALARKPCLIRTNIPRGGVGGKPPPPPPGPGAADPCGKPQLPR